MTCAVLLLVLVSIISVFCYPYANDYPHIQYEFRKDNRNGLTAADDRSYQENKVSDGADNRKAAFDQSKFHNTENLSKANNLQKGKKATSNNTLRETTGQDYENDESHNRKHIKSGFHNTYHKDEKGSNSSYYEDSDDRGGKLVYDKRHGMRGDENDSHYQENGRDENVRDKYDNRMASYDSRDAQERQHYLNRNAGSGFIEGQRKENDGGARYEKVFDQSNGAGGYYDDYPSSHRNSFVGGRRWVEGW